MGSKSSGGPAESSLLTISSTPLHSAIAASNDCKISKLLVQGGADLCSRNIEGKTPFHTFFRDINRELLASYRTAAETSLIDDRGMQLLHYIAWSSKSSVADIKPFLTGVDLQGYAKDDEGRSVLFFAAERGNIALLRYILNLPNRPHLEDTDANGLSLMHYAVRSRRVGTIDILSQHGCSFEIVDKNRQTALHHAVKRKNLEATKRLLSFDNSRLLDWKDINGRTPFDLAVRTKEKAIIECLASTPSSLSNIPKETNLPFCDLEATAATTLPQAMTQRIYRSIFKLGVWQVSFVAIVLALLSTFLL